MNLGVGVNILSFLILLYFTVQFTNTRKFIHKLPSTTKSKYLGLEILSRRVLVSNLILFILSVMVSNLIAKAVLTIIIGFTISYALSEINILKEYITNKKK